MVVADTQLGRYLDLQPLELLVAARALGFDACTWPWFPTEYCEEASSDALATTHAAEQLELRGLVKRGQAEVLLHPYMAQSIEIAARPSLVASVFTMGPDSAAFSWLFAEPKGAAAFSWSADSQSVRIRVLPSDSLPYALGKLAGLDPSAASSTCTARSVPAAALVELKDAVVAASQAGHDADLVNNPSVEAMSGSLSEAVRASVVTVLAREAGEAVRGEATVWVTEQDGSLCALDVAHDGSFVVSPVGGRGVHARFVGMLQKLARAETD